MSPSQTLKGHLAIPVSHPSTILTSHLHTQLQKISLAVPRLLPEAPQELSHRDRGPGWHQYKLPLLQLPSSSPHMPIRDALGGPKIPNMQFIKYLEGIIETSLGSLKATCLDTTIYAHIYRKYYGMCPSGISVFRQRYLNSNKHQRD